jgi:glutaredoxin
MITVYSRQSCAPCVNLKRWLDNKAVEYEEIDLDKQPWFEEEVVEKAGLLIVPVVEIGQDVVVGLNFKRLSELLNLL